jgi:capsular exopolysaccharide synthesis family protein
MSIDDRSESGALAPHQPNQGETEELVLLGPANGAGAFFGTGSGQPEILSGGFDLVWLLHSLRRRWLLAATLGLTAAVAAAALVWFVTPSKATATALLKVASRPTSIAFHVDTGGEPNFETYKRTQIELFNSHFVLQAALGKPGIAQLPTLAAEDDQIAWLRENLDVSFPGNAEVLRIAMEGENKDEIKQIVAAATQAYLDEIVYADRDNQLRVRDLLTRSYQKTTDEIRRKSRAFNDLAKQLHTFESHEAQVDRNIYLQSLSSLRAERDKIGEELMREEIKLSLLHAHRSDPALQEAKINEMLAADPQVGQLRQQIDGLELAILEEQTRARRSDAPSLVRLQDRAQQARRQLASRQAQLRPRIVFDLENSGDPQAQLDLSSIEIRKKFLTARAEQVASEIENVTDEIKRMGERSLELEALRNELDQLRKVASTMGSKIEAWDIELESPHRVTLVQPAWATPGLNDLQRYLLSGVAAMLGLGLVGFAVAGWDLRARKLNGPQQVDEGLGLQVMGELPPLANQKRLDASNPAVAMLSEGIDGVRTRLIYMNSSQDTRVVLVTSAAGGEGRTTVASQLAASLARAGRKTLLVDADLRRPSLHHLFELPLSDGLSEVLRSEAALESVVRKTHAEDLWLLTAGQCNAKTIQALAQDRIHGVLGELREQFEFIILDSAPALDLADSLIMGRHTDGAILAVRRDVSRVPQIHETRERLKNVGIRILGSVVNGVRRPMHDRAARMRLILDASAKH